MPADVLIRERKSARHGRTCEYRFQVASIDGKRQWITKGGFKTKKSAKEAGLVAMNEYNNCGKITYDSNISFSDFLICGLIRIAGSHSKALP